MAADITMEAEVEIKHFNTESCICRCCFSTDKMLYNIGAFHRQFLELFVINVMELDGLPQWICYECRALMLKTFRFYKQVTKAQSLWVDYINRCAPFPIEGQDVELKKYSRPHLLQTETLCFDAGSWSCDIWQHKKQILETELTLPCDDLDIEEHVKAEEGFSDYDDNLTLEEYKIINKSDIDVEELLQTALQEMKTEKTENNRNTAVKTGKVARNKNEKVAKVKNGKTTKTVEEKRRKSRIKAEQDELTQDEPKKTKIRNTIDIDPEKIEVINLDPGEEFRQRRENFSSENPKFPHWCHLCYIGFNYDYKLQNHMRKHSPSRGSFTCSMCAMHFPSAYSARVHALTHTRRYRCRRCAAQFRDHATATNHYSAKMANIKQAQKQFDSTMAREPEPVKIGEAQHEGITPIFTCDICGKVSTNSKTHRGHMSNSHGSRPECAHCGKTFVNLTALTEHMQIHQGIKNFECPKCGKRFRTRTQLKHHQLIHTDSKEFYCVECDIRFKTAQNLKQHLEKTLKHKDKQSFKFPCVTCGRRLESASSLARHVSVQHEGARMFACERCPARLATRNSLKKHVKIVHEAYRPPASHVCHHCGKKFRFKNVLMNHVRTHTGEKPFECGECGRRFTQRTARQTHVKLVHRKIPRRAPRPAQESDVKQERIESWTRHDVFFTVPEGT